MGGPIHMFYWLMQAKCIWKKWIMQQTNIFNNLFSFAWYSMRFILLYSIYIINGAILRFTNQWITELDIDIAKILFPNIIGNVVFNLVINQGFGPKGIVIDILRTPILENHQIFQFLNISIYESSNIIKYLSLAHNYFL